MYQDVPPPIQVDKGVPLPAWKRASKYPFDKMEVGDSFLLPRDGAEACRKATSKRPSARGKKFAIRKVSPSMSRCWRVE